MSHAPRAFSESDFAEHERSYRQFLALAKWCTVGVTALLVMMAMFLI